MLYLLVLAFLLSAHAQQCSKLNTQSLGIWCDQLCFFEPTGVQAPNSLNENVNITKNLTAHLFYSYLATLSDGTCKWHTWRYYCQKTFNDCDSSGNPRIPSQADYDTVLDVCDVNFWLRHLYIILGPRPDTQPVTNYFTVFPPGIINSSTASSCSSSFMTPNPIASPPKNDYIGRVNGLFVRFSLDTFSTPSSKNANFNGKFYNQENISKVDGFMIDNTRFFMRLYVENSTNPGQHVAEVYGTYTGSTLNFTSITTINPDYFPPSDSLVSLSVAPYVPVPTSRTAASGDYYSQPESAWIFYLGTALLVVYIVVVLLGVAYMKCSDSDWIDDEIRGKLYLTIRIGVSLGAILVIGASIAVLILKKDCNNFTVLDSDLTFQECTGGGCDDLISTTDTGGACYGCLTCCVTYDTTSLRLFGFCKESLVVWYSMVAPIGIAVIAIIVAFIGTRSSVVSV